MFTTVQTFSPSFTSLKRSSSSKRSSSLVVRAQRSEDFVQQIGKHAAVIATALVLTLVRPESAQTFFPSIIITFFFHSSFLQTPPAEAAVPAKKLTSFQKEQAYQAEMQAAIKARTGKATALPSLTASPTDFKVAETKSTTLKFTDSVEKVKIETPAAVPAPEPAVPAAAAAVVVAAPKPTPKPAPIAVTVAPAPAPTPAPVKAAVTAAPGPSAAAPAPAGGMFCI